MKNQLKLIKMLNRSLYHANVLTLGGLLQQINSDRQQKEEKLIKFKNLQRKLFLRALKNFASGASHPSSPTPHV